MRFIPCAYVRATFICRLSSFVIWMTGPDGEPAPLLNAMFRTCVAASAHVIQVASSVSKKNTTHILEPTDGRSHVRRSYHAMCRLGTRHANTLGVLIDASVAGVQCEISCGPLPCVGECVVLEWPDATVSFADVVWTKDRRIGLRLCYMAVDFQDRIDTASLGSESYSRIRLLQAEHASEPLIEV
ncbi:MAG: hypothetical protein JNL45_16985 [Hyphomicrobium sp.]|nr:hypothetical protein [Hyphomicrobium sp.]